MELLFMSPEERQRTKEGLPEPHGLEWLTETEAEAFMARLTSTLGVRPMGFIDMSDYFPPNRPVAQLVAEAAAFAELDEHDEAPPAVESWLQVSSPSLTYDLDRGLGDFESPEYIELRSELFAARSDGVRLATRPPLRVA
jgi:hypothetical protein